MKVKLLFHSLYVTAIPLFSPSSNGYSPLVTSPLSYFFYSPDTWLFHYSIEPDARGVFVPVFVWKK